MTDPTPSRWSHPYTTAVFFFAVFLALCLLRLPLPDRPVRDVDESVAAIIATSWLEGGVPYRDAIDQRGPVTYGIYALAFLVGGKNNMTAVHWALLLLIWAGCWLLYRLAPELGARDGEPDLPAGYLAAALFTVANFTYRPTQMLAFHTEWPVVVFSTLGMWLLWRALSREPGSGQGAHRLFLAGLAFGAAFLSKQPAVFDGLASGLFLLAWQWRRGRFVSGETLRRAGALAGGFATLVALNLAYFAAHGALGDFYLYFWSYNVEHYTAVVPVAERLRGLNPFHFNRHLLTANPLLFAAAVTGVVRLVVVFVRRGRDVVDAQTLLTLWLALAYFGASYSGRNFGHYFIQILCPACLLAALYLTALWRGASRFGKPLILRGLLVAATLVALAVPLYRFRDHIAVVEMQRPAPRKVAQDALVAWVIRETAPSDKIFVWGYNPEVYLLSNRRPATRYSNTNYLTGLLPWENHQPGVDTRAHIVPEAMDILLRELAENKPQLIIDTVPGNHRYYRKYPLEAFPRLMVFLRAGFQPVETIRDEHGRAYYEVWRRRG